MKLALEDIQQALKAVQVEPEQQIKVLNYLQEVIKEHEEHKQDNAAPKAKNEFGVVLYDTNNELNGKEFTASIYTILQGDNHNTVLNRISSAVREQNEAAKRKRNVINSIGTAFQFLKRRFIKEQNVNIKTKVPVRVIISNNQII